MLRDPLVAALMFPPPVGLSLIAHWSVIKSYFLAVSFPRTHEQVRAPRVLGVSIKTQEVRPQRKVIWLAAALFLF